MSIGIGGRAARVGLVAVAIGLPTAAVWLLWPVPARLYEQFLAWVTAPLASLLGPGSTAISLHPQHAHTLGVFRLDAPKNADHPVQVLNAANLHYNLPLLLALALVWPLAWPVAVTTADFAGRCFARMRVVLLSLALLAAAHALTLVAQVLELYSKGQPALGLEPWAAWGQTAITSLVWFLVLVGGPFFPVFIVAAVVRWPRARPSDSPTRTR